MVNHIEKIRAEIQKYFNPKLIIADSRETSTSPSGTYRIETVWYGQDKKDVNWIVTSVEIFETGEDEKIFSFFAIDRFFFSWQSKDESELLVCAEDMFGGQTVIDLTKKKMSSYSPDVDGFIWTEHYLSPDKNILAVIGCFWAAPYVLKLYSFDRPLDLPLKEIQELDLSENTENFVEWIDNKTIKLKNDNGEEREIKIGL